MHGDIARGMALGTAFVAAGVAITLIDYIAFLDNLNLFLDMAFFWVPLMIAGVGFLYVNLSRKYRLER